MSLTDATPESLCPIPEVSTMTRSKPTALQTPMARSTHSAISLPLERDAKERMYRLGSVNEFIRIRSPSSAPPVFSLVGSVARRATLVPGLSLWIRSMISSMSELFPAPPVPVIPTTGHSSPSFLERALESAVVRADSSPFSASVRRRPTDPWSAAVTGPSKWKRDLSIRSIL